MTNKEAINIISQMIKDEEGFLSNNTVEAHKMALKALEQEPKTGHWIEISRGFECDQCHGLDTDGLEPPYCKWCGTKMVEPQKGANE